MNENVTLSSIKFSDTPTFKLRGEGDGEGREGIQINSLDGCHF